MQGYRLASPDLLKPLVFIIAPRNTTKPRSSTEWGDGSPFSSLASRTFGVWSQSTVQVERPSETWVSCSIAVHLVTELTVTVMTVHPVAEVSLAFTASHYSIWRTGLHGWICPAVTLLLLHSHPHFPSKLSSSLPHCRQLLPSVEIRIWSSTHLKV